MCSYASRAARCVMTCSMLVMLLGVISGCAPVSEEAQHAEASAEPESIWTADASCDTCHAVQQESMDDSTCLAGIHASMGCMDCHQDAEGLASVHDGKSASDKMPTKLKATDVSAELCLSCHGESWHGLVQVTSDVMLGDSEGNVRNPHDQGDIKEHQTLTCYDCHLAHEENDVQKSAMAQCESCHHAGVFECGTCHE